MHSLHYQNHGGDHSGHLQCLMLFLFGYNNRFKFRFIDRLRR